MSFSIHLSPCHNSIGASPAGRAFRVTSSGRTFADTTQRHSFFCAPNIKSKSMVRSNHFCYCSHYILDVRRLFEAFGIAAIACRGFHINIHRNTGVTILLSPLYATYLLFRSIFSLNLKSCDMSAPQNGSFVKTMYAIVAEL